MHLAAALPVHQPAASRSPLDPLDSVREGNFSHGRTWDFVIYQGLVPGERPGFEQHWFIAGL